MIRNSTLTLLLALPAIFVSKRSSATNINDLGTATTYNLTASDSLTIVSGTYTGLISSFPAGAKITVMSAASFYPSASSFSSPGSAAKGTIYVHGVFKYAGDLITNSPFKLYNYNQTWITGTTKMLGSGQIWTNYYGALLKFDGKVTMTSNNAITNKGLMTCASDLDMTATTSITNDNVITIAGNYLNSGGTLTNRGRFQTTGSMTFNAGTAIINNHCRMIADGGIVNTTGALNNYSYIWARGSSITNSGNIYNAPIARMHAINFTFTGGSLTGSGYLYFHGTTSMTGGTAGAPAPTTDSIRFYDVTRTNPSTIFDIQPGGGTRYPNFIYKSFTAPDSTMAFLPGCAIELASEIPLSVKWNYFQVNLSENIPGLNWSAQTDAGTMFEIERSYNGINFSSIDFVASHPGQSTYDYNDNGVDNHSTVVYYRIKAVEPTGAVRLSETKTVKFTNNAGITIQAIPNPFTSQFSINYQSSTKEMLFIKVFSLTGQLQLSKTVTANIGFNSIVVQQAISLAKGMYMVQISNGRELLATEKIIKQ
ncbi:MAG TPA: T9SS type A sorting domain-containing protein [Chitinophagaceae bacterium]